MNRRNRLAVIVMLMLALVAMASSGCAKEEKEKVSIVIGDLSDMTGPAGTMVQYCTWALQDLADYVNQEEPIPGVELSVVTYDTKYDPGRFVSGFDWLLERGAKVIYSVIPEAAETLKAQAEREKVPFMCANTTRPMVDPPGWVFCFVGLEENSVSTMIQYIGDQWDYAGTGRRPRVGCAGWTSPWLESFEEGFQYAADHPDEFDYAGTYGTPFGQMTWTSEVAALMDCDWIMVAGPGAPMVTTFMSEALEKGYEGRFFGQTMIAATLPLLVDEFGWDTLDGIPLGLPWQMWTYDSPLVDKVKDILYTYHPDEADAIIDMGYTSLGCACCSHILVEILREAVERVGAENFDGQAFYDTAINYVWNEGPRQIKFTSTDRTGLNGVGIWEISATAQDLVMVEEWVSLRTQ